jgi:hypothetical protein
MPLLEATEITVVKFNTEFKVGRGCYANRNLPLGTLLTTSITEITSTQCAFESGREIRSQNTKAFPLSHGKEAHRVFAINCVDPKGTTLVFPDSASALYKSEVSAEASRYQQHNCRYVKRRNAQGDHELCICLTQAVSRHEQLIVPCYMV